MGFLWGAGGGAEDRMGGTGPPRLASAAAFPRACSGLRPGLPQLDGGTGGICVELAAQVDPSLRLFLHPAAWSHNFINRAVLLSLG